MEDLVEIPKHTVIQYLRHKGGKRKNVPYGVIVAVKNGNYCGVQAFKIGYALCNKKDRFSKNMALKIAIGRANSCGSVPNYSGPFPHEVEKMFIPFYERCKKYYKV